MLGYLNHYIVYKMTSQERPASGIPPIEGGPERIFLEDAPAQWTELYAIARATVDESKPYEQQQAAARAVYKRALTFSVMDRERARFYSQGLITCLIGEEMVHGVGLANLIRQTASQLVAHHAEYLERLAEYGRIDEAPGPGLHIVECTDNDWSLPPEHNLPRYATDILAPGVAARYERLPMAERITAEALAVTVVDSKHRAYEPSPTISVSEAVDDILHRNQARKSALANTFEGADALLMEAVVATTGELFLSVMHTPIMAAYTPEQLRALIPELEARKAATLRVDQLNRLQKYAKVADGVLHITLPNQATADPPPQAIMPGQRIYTRNQALHCAAFPARVQGVGGEMVPIVTLTVPIMVESIILADRLLREAV